MSLLLLTETHMDLQQEALLARLGHYVHQDVEGNFILSEDDLQTLLTPKTDYIFLLLVVSSVATLALGFLIPYGAKLFV